MPKRPSRVAAAIVAVVVASALAVPGSAAAEHRNARVVEPTLVQRATLSADFLAPGPPSGALATPANGRTGPFPGQVIPGFSGMIDNGDGTFWAMPDNGFGAKGNSADFLLRLYHITPEWETGRRRCRRDRGRRVHLAARSRPPDPVPDRQRGDARAAAHRRRLRHRVGRAARGRHASGSARSSGRSCSTSTPPASCSPRRSSSPTASRRPTRSCSPARSPRVRSSRGFEAMARSQRRPACCTRSSRARSPTTRSRGAGSSTSSTPAPSAYTGRTWQYETDTDDNVIGDAFTVRGRRAPAHRARRLRGPGVGDQAALRDRPAPHRRRRLRREGAGRRPAAASPTPTASASPRRPARTASATRSRSRCSRSRSSCSCATDGILVGNDNNYPGSNGRVPGTPDDTEMIVLDLRRRPHAAVRRDAARDRPPRRQRLPARAHARRLRAGDPAVRRLHRARPRVDQGRRARRPPRERDRRHDRRRRPIPSSPPAGPRR